MTALAEPPTAKPRMFYPTVKVNDLSVVTGYETLLRAARLDTLEGLFAPGLGKLLSKPGLGSWRERVRVMAPGPHRVETGATGPVFYIKRFRRPPLGARREVRRAGNGARTVAGVEWNWLHRLAAEGIPCPKPVALGEETRHGREIRSALMIEGVAGISLERWAQQWAGSEPPLELVRRLLQDAAALVSRLHGHGYVHRDLYLSHILFNPEAPAERSLVFIDLQRVFRPEYRWSRWMVKELASLNYSVPSGLISRTDRTRWLRLYLDGRRAERSGEPDAARPVAGAPGSVGAGRLDGKARRLVYLVTGKTERIARREARRMARRKATG